MRIIIPAVLSGLALFFSFIGLPGRSQGNIVLSVFFLSLAAVLAWVFSDKDTMIFGKIVISLFLVGFICFGYLIPSDGRNMGLSTITGMEAERYPSVRFSELTITFGGGEIVTSKVNDDRHYSANLHGESGAIPSQGVVDDRAQIWFNQRQRLWWANRRVSNNWDIQLSPDIYWSINTKLAHCSASLDFRGVPIENFVLTVVNSDVSVKVDRIDAFNIIAYGSIVRLLLPTDFSVDAKATQLFGRNNVDEFVVAGGDARLYWLGYFSSLEVINQPYDPS